MYPDDYGQIVPGDCPVFEKSHCFSNKKGLTPSVKSVIYKYNSVPCGTFLVIFIKGHNGVANARLHSVVMGGNGFPIT